MGTYQGKSDLTGPLNRDECAVSIAMTTQNDSKNPTDDAEAVDAPEGVDAVFPPEPELAAEAEAGTEEAAVDDPLAQAEKERDEVQDRLLRVTADYQNFVRRSRQNITDARDQQLIDVARSLITVLDHFDRALEIDPEAVTAASVFEGVQMVRDELLKALERFGVRRMNVGRGDEFDPNQHEALMRQPVEDLDSNHIAAQLQPGYTLGDKTVRPAQVTVAE